VVLIAWLHLFRHGTNIDHNELPLDDAGTWGVAVHSLVTVFTLPTEFHSQPPLYYLVLHFIAGINDAPWVLRGFLVFFLRMLREPTRRRAFAYAVWTLLMAYTMAFEVAVLLVQGVFFALVCCVELPWKGPGQLWRRRHMLFLAMMTVAIGYLPYLAMAIHYQYRPNPVDTTSAVLNFLTCQNTFAEHFGFTPIMLTLLGLFSVVGLFHRFQEGRLESLLLPLLCAGQVAFVWYFIVGRSSIGPLGKYMMPAFVAACLLFGHAWQRLGGRW
jgi:hypothetical protein